MGSKKHFPKVTTTLISVNAIAFAACLVQSSSLNVVSRDVLTRMGGISGPASWQVFDYVTYAFLHVNVFHFLSNMLFLYVTGRELERLIGGVQMLGIYIFCCVVPGLISALMCPQYVTVGASGALFGLMAATATIMHIVMRYNEWTYASLKYQRNIVIGSIVLNLVLSMLAPFTSTIAHVAGIVAGVFFVMLLVTFSVIKNKHR